MKYIVDIKGDIEGDYEIIGKYEERPKGQWHRSGECSVCLKKSYLTRAGIIYGFDFTRFCKNCGADMRGENKVVDDRLIRKTPIYDRMECIGIHEDCIITKEEFLECFNEWIVKPLQENPVSLQTKFCVPVDNGCVTPV